MSHWGSLLAVLALIGAIAAPSPVSESTKPACATAPGWLFLEHASQAIIVDPDGDWLAPVDVAPATIEYLHRPLSLASTMISPRWDVTRVSRPDGYEFTVRDPDTGRAILSATFERRIEITASTVSPTGRFTVFIQANNLASEITVLDAMAGERHDLRIPHDEELAAFAIDSAFSRDESCLALSMERVGGKGPETWLVDLETGDASPAMPGFLIVWA